MRFHRCVICIPIAELKQTTNKVKELETKANKLTQSMNDLEQYGRRQNIRLNNVSLPDKSRFEGVVLNILNNALPVTTESIKTEDIDRCHPIGKPNKKQNRQVIVKFASYKLQAKAYDARFNLSNVYMTEDFTATNLTVLNQLIHLKKAKRIKKIWPNNGKIFAKVTDEQPKSE